MKSRTLIIFLCGLFIGALIFGVAYVMTYNSRQPKFVKTDNAMYVAAKVDMENINTALIKFKNDVGRFPTSTEKLSILVHSTNETVKGWNGPYLSRLPSDPWGNPYIYRSPGRDGAFDLLCNGLAGKSFSAQDITPHYVPQ
jgi:type II secretion system protein G